MSRTRKMFFTMLISVLALFSVNLAVFAQDEPLPYLNPDLSIDERVEDLLARMSLEEKIGQMTLVEKNSLLPADVTTYYIGGVLSGGGAYPTPNTPEAWLDMVNSFQDASLATPLSIPLIYGVDAVHGHNNVRGAVIFPHNIGLGASRNAELVGETARITALEMMATGIYWNYAPVLAVPQDIRWGRTYEGFGENTDLVTELSLAYLLGLQGDGIANNVLGTPKHYVGDGGAVWGTSSFGPNFIDRGVTEVDEETLRAIHLPPYLEALDNGAMSIMASFSSWGGLNMHAHHYLLTEVLKGELSFEGFIVSDWGGVDLISESYYESVVASINAGVDMNMVPQDYRRFIDMMNRGVENGDISLERIDDAVRRILRTKFELGLFERPQPTEELVALVGSDEHRAIAREAVQQSLVLLKNENETLPLSADAAQTIFVAGVGADDIGLQSGGWTIEWQGGVGNITDGTTILQGIQAAVSEDTTIAYNRFGRFDRNLDENGDPLIADVGIVVLAETPYTEWEGDSATISLSNADLSTVARMRERSEKLVVVLLSGRPVIITNELVMADAFVAAWLPGSEGNGVTDVLFGDAPFTGRLSYTWPRNLEQIPFDLTNLATEGCEAPLFPYDYGLTTDASESEWVALALECDPPVVPEEITVDSPVTGAELIAPAGEEGMTYHAPFPVSITLDGNAADWAGVPTVTMEAPNGTVIAFAAAADAENLYFYADVTDDAIISGAHGGDYWNEDSVEFYVNGTGDLTATSYSDGIAQLTVAALPDATTNQAIISGVRSASVNARAVSVETDNGYRVEMAVPLVNDVWEIALEHENVIGFQVHLNGASVDGRDTKLVWSIYDGGDQSYQNPSVFGELSFFQVGEVVPVSENTSSEPTPTPYAVDNSINWDSREWNLIWSDEFDGEAGTPINSRYWSNDIGGHGWGNNELQYYTTRSENASLDGNGNLAIVAREENPLNYNCRYGACRYTSARILTQGKFEFTYGRVEARLQIPYGQGIWPAFWMLGANFNTVGWPGSGEIDIMENVGHEPRTTHGTIHGPGYSGANGIGGSNHGSAPFADDFHVYAIEWDPNVIRWYVDGELFNTITVNHLRGRPWVYDHDFFLILNVAVGGNWPGSPDETTVFPQTMLVDYVRVYQLAETAAE